MCTRFASVRLVLCFWTWEVHLGKRSVCPSCTEHHSMGILWLRWFVNAVQVIKSVCSMDGCRKTMCWIHSYVLGCYNLKAYLFFIGICQTFSLSEYGLLRYCTAEIPNSLSHLWSEHFLKQLVCYPLSLIWYWGREEKG